MTDGLCFFPWTSVTREERTGLIPDVCVPFCPDCYSPSAYQSGPSKFWFLYSGSSFVISFFAYRIVGRTELTTKYKSLIPQARLWGHRRVCMQVRGRGKVTCGTYWQKLGQMTPIARKVPWMDPTQTLK